MGDPDADEGGMSFLGELSAGKVETQVSDKIISVGKLSDYRASCGACATRPLPRSRVGGRWASFVTVEPLAAQTFPTWSLSDRGGREARSRAVDRRLAELGESEDDDSS
jgi:hypothetical protein